MRILSSILLLVLFLSSCDEPLPPLAVMDVFPSIGDSTVLFELNASESSDERTYAVALQYRWDFDNDLAWDTEYSYEPIYVMHFPVPGIYHITVEVMNFAGLTSVANDSIIVFGRNQDVSTLTDPRDGQSYSIVKIENRWWMSKSLRYGTIIDPLNQAMSGNNIVERIAIENCSRPGSYSVYSWFEAMNYNLTENQGICPDGWHIPTMTEWKSLYAKYPMKYIATYLGENGFSGLNLQNGERVDFDPIDKMLYCNIGIASYWSSDHRLSETDIFQASLLNYYQDLSIVFAYVDRSYLEGNNKKQLLNTVRCIKDQD